MMGGWRDDRKGPNDRTCIQRESGADYTHSATPGEESKWVLLKTDVPSRDRSLLLTQKVVMMMMMQI